MTLSQKDAVKQYCVDTEADLVKTDVWPLGPSTLTVRVEHLEQVYFRLQMSCLDLLDKVKALENKGNISVKENNSPSSQNNAPYSDSNDQQLEWLKRDGHNP